MFDQRGLSLIGLYLREVVESPKRETIYIVDSPHNASYSTLFALLRSY